MQHTLSRGWTRTSRCAALLINPLLMFSACLLNVWLDHPAELWTVTTGRQHVCVCVFVCMCVCVSNYYYWNLKSQDIPQLSLLKNIFAFHASAVGEKENSIFSKPFSYQRRSFIPLLWSLDVPQLIPRDDSQTVSLYLIIIHLPHQRSAHLIALCCLTRLNPFFLLLDKKIVLDALLSSGGLFKPLHYDTQRRRQIVTSDLMYLVLYILTALKDKGPVLPFREK